MKKFNCLFFCTLIFLSVSVPARSQEKETLPKKHEIIAGLAINKPFPAFELAAKGLRLNQDSLKGKVTFINFWFEACPPCQAEMQGLGELFGSIKDDAELRFYSFTFEMPSVIKRMTKKKTIQFPAYSIDQSECSRLSFSAGYPTNIIIDKDGIVRYFKAGGSRDQAQATQHIMQRLLPLMTKLKSSQ